MTLNHQTYIKASSIVFLVILTTIIHYSAVHGQIGMHILHRELYFIPILMAAFWFGLKTGVVTSLIVCLVYAPHVFIYDDPHAHWLTVLTQIFVFILVSVILGAMVDSERKKRKERDFINETFGKYVDRKVRDEVLSNRVSLDGEFKEVTILFADLRNFSGLVKKTNPKEVVRILNEYFSEMADAIKENHGMVLQYIGDEIEAVFGAPIALDNHENHAVKAALAMRDRLSRVNLKLINQGYAPLKHGIGIYTGQVLAANIGSHDRLSYTMIGESVNIASRLQELNKKFNTDILISDTTRKNLDQTIKSKPLPPTTAKGYREKIAFHKLSDNHWG